MSDLLTEDFDYQLPDDLIASRPLDRRDASRMMVIDRSTGQIEHASFRDFPSKLFSGDLVVLNNTRVVRSRFFSDDNKIEVVRLEAPEPTLWRCLVRPGKKMRLGTSVCIGGIHGTVESIYENGDRLIRFHDVVEEERGQLALPHYMNRSSDKTDLERYQTVFADDDKAGAIAAPTAGLHFTDELLKAVPHAFLTLHVGAGTFQPVRVDHIIDHKMHSERFDLPPDTAAALGDSDRIVAVGTTVTRVLEHSARQEPPFVPGPGATDIFIYPGFKFQRVDALLTNFHLPKSTLFMLVSAFAGRDLIQEAYQQAIAERYRFYSYGDCMLIL
jgi:S-adenosylmethionine:tRNA ribosyltransferase-isomerase